MRPTFLVIGAQRAGTTRLHVLLSRHPDIHIPRHGTNPFAKEIHFFSGGVLRHDLDWYEDLFTPQPGAVSRPVRGEITPAYATVSAAMAAQIQRYLPELRIVFVIRNPLQRVWSHLLMMLSDWNPATTSVPVALMQPRSLVPRLETAQVWLRTDYQRTIKIWTDVFGAEALRVALAEDLFGDNETELRKILRHIGADDAWSPPKTLSGPAIYASPKVAMPDFLACYVARGWLPKMLSLNQSLGGRIEHWISELRAACRGAGPRFHYDAMRYRLASGRTRARSFKELSQRDRCCTRRLRTLLDQIDIHNGQGSRP